MNPIVQRELSQQAKRPTTFRLRVWVAGGAILLYFLFSLSSGNFAPGAPGFSSAVYGFLMMPALAFVLLSGAFTTADCLSSERRAGTLGLVFLTRMRPGQVLLGKLFSATLPTFYALIALIPVLALPVLGGGVAGDDFICLILALVVCLLLSSCVGLLVSSIWRGSTETTVVTVGLMVGPLLLFPFLALVFDSLSLMSLKMLFFRDVFQDFGALEMVLQSRGNQVSNGFWISVITQLTIACSCYWAAVRRVRLRLARSDGEDEPRMVSNVRCSSDSTQVASVGWSRRRNSYRPRVIDDQPPLGWLAARYAQFSIVAWAMICIGAAVFVGVLFDVGAADVLEVTIALPLLHVFLKGVIASEACRAIHRQRDEGMLELLSVSPVAIESLPEMFKAQIEGSARSSIRVVMVTSLIACGFVLFLPGFNVGLGSRVLVGAIVLVGVILLYHDVDAVIELGMLNGLIHLTERRALLRVLRQMILVPWLWLFLAFVGGILMGGGGGLVLLVTILLWQITYCFKSIDAARSSRHECRAMLRSREFYPMRD